MQRIEVAGEGNVQTATMWLPVGNTYVNHHYYSRFIADKTELWFFGCGLGEQAIFTQMGAAFLEECAVNDPALGRIMLASGLSATACYPYKGDFNLWWAFGDHEGWQTEHFQKTTILPRLCLCTSQKHEEVLKEMGWPTLRFPFAVGKDFFPLNLERKGLGYAGSPIKPNDQYKLIVEPIVNRPDFEWISKQATDKYLTLPELNEWYNRKQIVFAMAGMGALKYDTPPNRFFETLASGTPFITAKYNTREILGFQYPFMAETPEQTLQLVEDILADYPRHLRLFAKYSGQIREKHNWNLRVKTLFEALKHGTNA